MVEIKQFSKNDLKASFLLLIVAILSSIALTKESELLNYLGEGQGNHYEKIGVILEATNTVKKKMVADPHWQRAIEESDVFHQQMIFTDENSTSTIRLSDNSLIHLDPGSLVVFLKNGNREVLEIKSGGISGSFKNVTLTHKGKKLKVSSKASKIQVKKNTLKVIHEDKKAAVVVKEKFVIKEDKFIKLSSENKERNLILKEGALVFPLNWNAKAIDQLDLVIERIADGRIEVTRVPSILAKSYVLKLDKEGSYTISAQDTQTRTISSNKISFQISPMPEVEVQLKNPHIKIDL